jgi:MFS family permease
MHQMQFCSFTAAVMNACRSVCGPTGILGLSAVGGPLLAGLLIDANLFELGWRPMFLINIVLGAAGLAAGLRLLRATSATAR